MNGQRAETRRLTAALATKVGMVCLLLSLAVPALAIDPGDGTQISSQQLRRPVGASSDKIVPMEFAKGDDMAGHDKAELSVYQVFSMHFGTLCHNDGYVVLDANDTITADPSHLVYGGSSFSAEIRLNGDAFRACTIAITAGSTTGFHLSNFETDFGTPPLSGMTLDGTGYFTFHLGSRLQLDASEVTPGSSQQIGYTVSAVYE